MDYKNKLLSPIKIGTRTCKNRFFVQPLECANSDEEGNPTEDTYKRYESLYKGEFGMIDLESITVTNESRARERQLAIMPHNEKAIANMMRKLKEVNPNVLMVFQLTHSGEISSPDFSRRVTVKPLYGYEGDLLSEEEVDKIMDQIVLSAKIAHNAGADGVDLKFCHGFLGSQILRPYNDRKWKYGGSWANRSRFAFDLIERISNEINDKNFLLGSKLSMWEGFPGGCGSAGPDSPLMDLTESIDLIKGLEQRGASYFVESLGNAESSLAYILAPKTAPYLSYLHFYFSNIIKQNVKPETVVIGSHLSSFRGKENELLAIAPEHSSMFAMGAKCIEEGIMDMIALGRQSFADPHTPLKLREGREDEITYCIQCMKCTELLLSQNPAGCVVNGKDFQERYKQLHKIS